jgi:hypothetical protein
VQAYREGLIPEREAVVALTEQANYTCCGQLAVLMARQQEYNAYAAMDAQRKFWNAHRTAARDGMVRLEESR